MPYCIQGSLHPSWSSSLAASVYMVFARIIHPIHAEKHSVFPLNWLRTFVLSDIVTFVVQVGGSKAMVLLICYHCIFFPDKDALQPDYRGI